MVSYQPQITLIDKNEIQVTPITINGDSSIGNLTQYRVSGRYADTINGKIKNGTLVLRCPAGLFFTKEPILNSEFVKDNYLIQVLLQQGAIKGKLFRFEISKVTSDVGEKGRHISLELTGYDVRIQEFLDSDNHRLQTPRETFLNRITNFLQGRLLSGRNVKISDNPLMINLPDTANLRQDWLVSSPVTTKKHFDEIIRRISTPEVIGSTNEDWYYEIHPTSENFTESFEIMAGKMGEVDSDVILDENDSTLSLKTDSFIDNTKYKNSVIIKGKNGTHTIPMEFTRLASDITHAKLSESWIINNDYSVGDYAKLANSLYKCLVSHTSNAANTPGISGIHWENLNTTTRGSEWTNNITHFENNISNPDQENYAGFFNDFNIVKPHFDRDDVFSEFETISLKDVIEYTSDPPDSPKHGQRYLINNGTGAWANQNNRIAQYDESITPGIWRFSKSPIQGDIVHVRNLARQLRFDGVTWQNSWVLDNNYDVASAFHPIKSITKVPNRNNISKAIQFRFDWNAFTAGNVASNIFDIMGLFFGSTRFSLFGNALGDTINDIASFLSAIGRTESQIESEFGTGDVRNAASRWAGWNIIAPFGTGDNKILNSIIDTQNLNQSIHTGEKGWNHGVQSENLGICRGLEFWCKLLFQNNAGDEINGLADVPFVFWFRDLQDRIVYTEFTIRAHNSWQKITIPIGNNSDFKLHDSRIDELFTIFGFTFPHNFFIKERELTGVQFDWSKVREFGCFYRGSYDNNYFYAGAQNRYLESITQHLSQYASNFVAAGTAGIIDAQKLIINHCIFQIDDIHFLKDAYVTSSENLQESPRMIQIQETEQFDYINLQTIAKRKEARLQFHPESHLIDCRGDVRIVPGQKITLRGSSTSTEKELVPTEVIHIEDSTGYHIQIKAIRKFAV